MNERGSITLLTTGFLVFLGLLTVVVVDASAVFLAHQRLAAVADGAALSAAEGLEQQAFYASGVVKADGGLAQRLAGEYGAVTDPAASVAASVVGETVQVRLAKVVSLPIAPPGWGGRTTVRADSTAQLIADR